MLAEAVKGQIYGFYEEYVPTFSQGPAVNELQYLVTAEEVTGYVRTIEKLRLRLKTIAEYPVTDKNNPDAHNMQGIAREEIE